jgi:NAD(P)-dependent dehydrogenase (short-subunit alcohol dehydrogenase family)
MRGEGAGADHSGMDQQSVVLITGASKGLGLSLARAFAKEGHRVVINARDEGALRRAAATFPIPQNVLAVAGDVSESAEDIAREAIDRFGRVDILINNASELGPSPMPKLLDHPWESLLRVFRVNVVAPIHLIQLLRPSTVVNITSDAAVNAYPGWGGYGASKAALEHASRILAKELGDDIRVLVVDPGDMNTEMHAQAEPGVDLSHLPHPDEVAPRIIRLIEERVSERVVA